MSLHLPNENNDIPEAPRAPPPPLPQRRTHTIRREISQASVQNIPISNELHEVIINLNSREEGENNSSSIS